MQSLSVQLHNFKCMRPNNNPVKMEHRCQLRKFSGTFIRVCPPLPLEATTSLISIFED